MSFKLTVLGQTDGDFEGTVELQLEDGTFESLAVNGKDDLVVVFFSGHGATDETGSAYWVMNDTQVGRLRATAFGW